MTQKEIIKKLKDLEESLKDKENKCYDEMKYMRDHNFKMEEAALKYRQEAYNDCWLNIWNLRFAIEQTIKK